MIEAHRSGKATLLLLAAVFLLLIKPSGVFAQGSKEIAPGVYSFDSGVGYHSMFLVTDEGVAVFETINSGHAQKLVSAINEITDKPIVYAFHSHNHWDHASGGKVFQELGAKTVMHKFAAEWFEANPGMDTSPPDIVWEGAHREFTIGGKVVDLHYLGLNHGLGMTVFTLPESRTAYIADLVTPNRVMFTIVPDFNIKELERTLAEILELEFDTAVCSHSALPADEVGNGCSKTHVQEALQFIRDLRGAIMAEMGKGTQNIPAAIKLPKYETWAYYDQWLEMNAWRVMLDMGMGPYPWVPGQSVDKR